MTRKITSAEMELGIRLWSKREVYGIVYSRMCELDERKNDGSVAMQRMGEIEQGTDLPLVFFGSVGCLN